MTDTPLILDVDTEALVVRHLLATPEIVALGTDSAGNARVYTVLPKDVTYPCLRVTQFGDVSITVRPFWLAQTYLTVEAFGGTKAQARLWAATARAVLLQRLADTDHDLGVVAHVESDSLWDQPDETMTPAKPRWQFTASVWTHPHRS